MAASIKYLRASDGTGSAILAHVTVERIAGATTLKADNLDNWPAYFIATTGTLNPAGYIIDATKKEFRGHKDGSDIIIDGFEPGFTDTGNTTDQVIILKQTTSWANIVVDSLEENQTNLIQYTNELLADSIVPGTGEITTVSGREASISDITYYMSGIRLTKTGIPNKTLTATKDTYGYIDASGNVTYQEVAVNAAAPATPANSIPFAKLRTNASAVTRITLLGRGSVGATQLDFPTLGFGNYSTAEVDTGFTWIDGSPIYKKTIDTGGLPNSGTKNVPHGITGYTNIVSMTGGALRGSDKVIIPLPTPTYTNATIGIYATAGNVCIECQSNRADFTSSTVTILYTKL